MILKELYHQIYGQLSSFSRANCKDLAGRLSKAVGRTKINGSRLEKPWSGPYLYNVLMGYEGYSITDEITRACLIVGAMEDGISELQARARPVTILTTNGIRPGAMASPKLHSKPCAGCGMEFIPHVLHQQYHDKDCRQRFNAMQRHSQRANP